MNILLFLGSIRPERESSKPAFYIRDLLEEKGHTVDFIDLMELNLPVFNDTPEQMHSPEVQRIISSIAASDAIVMVFPEYNHNIGGAMRNALDFLRHQELLHRPVSLVGVSNGSVGGARAIYTARGGFPTFGAVLLPTAVQVYEVPKSFPDAEHCVNERVEATIQKMIVELEAYAPALAEVRKTLSVQ